MGRVRKKEGEDFSKDTIKRVIDLLETDKPITKKAACDMLNITYNTTRLTKIIQQYKDDEEYIKTRKKQLRGTPISKDEKAAIISSYLEGDSFQYIEDTTFRSNIAIKRVLKEYGIPDRETSKNYESVILPDDSVQENYEPDDLVFSAKYNTTAKIGKHVGNGVYSLWIYGNYMQWAYQPYWELGSLTRAQKELGVDVESFDHDEYVMLINQGLAKAKKMKNVQN